jgi:hypothetical protein
MKFVWVNGRMPRHESFCALRRKRIEESYVRELEAGLSYCSQDCYLAHGKAVFHALIERARASC